VVEVDTASGSSDDTTGVRAEGGLVSLDGDGDGAKSDGVEKSLVVVDGDIVVALNLDNTVTLVVAGGVEHGGVGVVFLEGDGGAHGVVEGTVHKTATAGKVSVLP
jgi:hypothetical protein